jgi:hypothetical protein
MERLKKEQKVQYFIIDEIKHRYTKKYASGCHRH